MELTCSQMNNYLHRHLTAEPIPVECLSEGSGLFPLALLFSTSVILESFCLFHSLFINTPKELRDQGSGAVATPCSACIGGVALLYESWVGSSLDTSPLPQILLIAAVSREQNSGCMSYRTLRR